MNEICLTEQIYGFIEEAEPRSLFEYSLEMLVDETVGQGNPGDDYRTLIQLWEAEMNDLAEDKHLSVIFVNARLMVF